jgi:hypothetical protein
VGVWRWEAVLLGASPRRRTQTLPEKHVNWTQVLHLLAEKMVKNSQQAGSRALGGPQLLGTHVLQTTRGFINDHHLTSPPTPYLAASGQAHEAQPQDPADVR